MHYAIIGCIHGNIEALQAVVADIRARGIERVVCLGDIVGFGPDPVPCIDVVRDTCFMVLKGDHEAGVITEKPVGFIKKTADTLTWTRAMIQEADTATGDDRLSFLATGTQDSFNSAGITFVHGTPRSRHEHLFPTDVKRDPRKLRAAFAMMDKVCFHGHTHYPGVFRDAPFGWQSPDELGGHFHYSKGMKALINVGSVGQPRDGDPRACYLEINKNDMFWRRVEYDVGAVVQKLQAIEAFTPALAIRLQQGR